MCEIVRVHGYNGGCGCEWVFFHEGCRCEGVCAGKSGEGVCV